MKRRSLIAGAAGLAAASHLSATVQPATAQTAAPSKVLDNKVQGDMVEVKVAAVYSPTEPEGNRTSIVVLKALNAEKYLPIWINRAEGDSIDVRLKGIKLQRPLSHDLMVQLLKALDGQVKAISVRVIEETIFYATITVAGKDKSQDIDSRPSDAIALAVRLEAPLYVAAALLQDTTLEQLNERLNK